MCHLFELILQLSVCTLESSFTLFYFSPSALQFFLIFFFLAVLLSVSLILLIIGSTTNIYPLLLPCVAELAKRCPLLKTSSKQGINFHPLKAKIASLCNTLGDSCQDSLCIKCFTTFSKSGNDFGYSLLIKQWPVSLSGRRHDHRGFLRWERLPLRHHRGGPLSCPEGCHQSCPVSSSPQLHLAHFYRTSVNHQHARSVWRFVIMFFFLKRCCIFANVLFPLFHRYFQHFEEISLKCCFVATVTSVISYLGTVVLHKDLKRWNKLPDCVLLRSGDFYGVSGRVSADSWKTLHLAHKITPTRRDFTRLFKLMTQTKLKSVIDVDEWLILSWFSLLSWMLGDPLILKW